MTIRCSVCTLELDDNATECPFCGVAVESAVPDAAKTPDEKKTVNIETEFICSGCGKEYLNGEKFCPECGGKIEEKQIEKKSDIITRIVSCKKICCSGCGKEYLNGGKFCPECGGKIEETEVKTEQLFRIREVKKICCSGCGKEYRNGGKFCPECGEKIEEISTEEEIPVPFREVRKNVCTGCGKEYRNGEKFCPECGGKIEIKVEKEILSEEQESGENLLTGGDESLKYSRNPEENEQDEIKDDLNSSKDVLRAQLPDLLNAYKNELEEAEEKPCGAVREKTPVEWINEYFSEKVEPLRKKKGFTSPKFFVATETPFKYGLDKTIFAEKLQKINISYDDYDRCIMLFHNSDTTWGSNTYGGIITLDGIWWSALEGFETVCHSYCWKEIHSIVQKCGSWKGWFLEINGEYVVINAMGSDYLGDKNFAKFLTAISGVQVIRT